MTQKKVLIVDDSKLMRIIIKKILSVDNLFVVTGEAGNGIEALAELEREMPDIIFLDIEMPEMDGVEALKEIRAKYSTKVVVAIVTDNRLFPGMFTVNTSSTGFSITNNRSSTQSCIGLAFRIG